MTEILRVPPHCVDNFYDMMMTYYSKVDLSINEFRNKTKSIYVVFNGTEYLGIGYIYYGIKDKNRVYNLSIAPFIDLKYYDIYMLIKTIIKDCTDQPIILSSDILDKTIINALKNNGFRLIDENYIRPNGYNISELIDMNPRNGLHVIDKMISCKCDSNIEEARDKYINDLLKSNSENKHINCCNNTEMQTVEEFLGENSNCCHHCCIND